jgi:hypothetical protein
MTSLLAARRRNVREVGANEKLALDTVNPERFSRRAPPG